MKQITTIILRGLELLFTVLAAFCAIWIIIGIFTGGQFTLGLHTATFLPYFIGAFALFTLIRLCITFILRKKK